MEAYKRLKHERLYQDLSEQQLENMIGAAPGTVKRIESGDIRELHRYKQSLGIALGVSKNFFEEY
ncbi:MAG: hypothetical protein ACTTIO_04280 [Candidatus Fimenecus sp.]